MSLSLLQSNRVIAEFPLNTAQLKCCSNFRYQNRIKEKPRLYCYKFTDSLKLAEIKLIIEFQAIVFTKFSFELNYKAPLN